MPAAFKNKMLLNTLCKVISLKALITLWDDAELSNLLAFEKFNDFELYLLGKRMAEDPDVFILDNKNTIYRVWDALQSMKSTDLEIFTNGSRVNYQDIEEALSLFALSITFFKGWGNGLKMTDAYDKIILSVGLCFLRWILEGN